MTRLTASVIDRIRALSPRARAAVLAILGIGTIGGGVVVVDRTRPRVEPPPVVEPPVRPPPVDPGTRPPPVDPPPVVPSEFAPEAFHEHSFYGDAIGNLTFTDCTFGPDWTTKPTTKYSQWDNDSGSHAGKSYTGVEWGAWGNPTGLAHAVLNLYGPVQANIAFTDCAWLAAPHPQAGTPSTMRWGVRGFGMMDVTFDRCAFSRGMAAGTQVALRATAAHGSIIPSGVHRYERCTFVGIGDPKSERWGAFTISEHKPEDYGFTVADIEVQIIDCTLIGGHLDWKDGNGKAVKSSRGIMANGRKRVVIEGLHLDYEAPYSDWSIQLWGIDDGDPTKADVVIKGSYVREGIVEIISDGEVEVAGNTGGATLTVKALSGAVLHKGALSAGYMTPVVK